MRKLRPFLWPAIAALVVMMAGLYGWYRFNLRPVPGEQSVSFEIPPGEGAAKIADRLEAAKLIRSSTAFLTYITVHGYRSSIQAGSYSLSQGRSASEIIAILSQGEVVTNLLVVPEGSTLKKITAIAVKHEIPQTDFEAALSQEYSFDFLAARPAGQGLEGYLFPDSYKVASDTTAETLISAMLANFNRKITPELKAGFSRQGLNLHQAVTLASIVEREVPDHTDRQKVAQVMLKRLREGMRLETDPTVAYAAEREGVAFSLDIDSPYNTYRREGLPPGPIAAPGLSSYEAVADPADTDYLYFVTGTDKITRFSRTFAEHERNIARFGVSGR